MGFDRHPQVRIRPADRSGMDMLRISTCKCCGLGVYRTQRWKFYSNPTGISHVECVEPVPVAVTQS